MDEDEDAGSCMKDVFKKVLTLYIHEATKKEKEDSSESSWSSSEAFSLPSESIKKLSSEEFQVKANELVNESVKCFLHQLLFPSCPSKAVGPEDFIQGTPSSSGCLAKTAYESCSGDSSCSSQTLSETVDLLRDRVVNQVMEAVSSVADGENQVVKTTRSSTAESIQAVGLSSEYGVNRSVKDVACSTSSLGLIIGLHTDSANRLGEPKSKVKTEVKICIKPKIKTLRVNKKYVSKKNVVGPVMFEANASANKLQGNDMRQGTAGQSSEAQTSTSQTEKGSEGKSKKRNIFARFFSSISKSVRKCCVFQFVVMDDQDYKAHFTDPDSLVNWDCVQQVRIYSHEVPSCPICLYPPVAAQITRCGHIFCWPCMLHFLSLSDKDWSKCPICYEAVNGPDLMRSSMHGHLGTYSKLLLASEEQVLGLLQEEKEALRTQLCLEENDPQDCFIQSALHQLQEREESLLKRTSQDVSGAEGLDLRKLSLSDPPSPEDAVVVSYPSSKTVLQYSSAFDDEVQVMPDVDPVEVAEEVPEGPAEALVKQEADAEAPQAVEGPPVGSQTEMGKPQTSEPGPYYYFYQADDGQQMFLHPVNVRCLLREYGSLEASPPAITATVVEVEGKAVTEEVRRRHRYLAHLPLTCEFSICELALQPPVLSKETLDSFADDLEKRKRLRQKKARDEKRRERRIEMEENRKQGKYPEVHIGLENLQQFPAFGSPPDRGSSPPAHPEFLLAPPSPLSSSPASDGLMFPSLGGHSPVLSVGSMEDDSHCMSFAQMLRDGKARGDVGPKITPKKVDMLLAPPVADSDGESDGSDRVPVPSFQNSFSQAFEKALMQLDHGPPAAPQLAPMPEEKGGKKKKKKQKLLFSTSMVHTK
ncbi:E3 ubiquitin-protein ligase RNF10-like [Sardina pilchardus]|uniref:E3 ubiquitin-protein ligase RNF10-like n=1 Tax=Sardina pilchardus TaxID=27697 RepID=UPI002E15AF8B